MRGIRAIGTTVTALVLVGAVGAGTAQAGPPPTPPFKSTIEGYSPYQPQTYCVSSPSAGILGLRQIVQDAYPGVGYSGPMLRSCSSGGTSEHKDGRAWDWMVDVSDAREKAAADQFLGWLTERDYYGHANARLRRLGVMYIIWNKRIFRSYRAWDGWQPYYGSVPHTNHVHFSLGWDGARKQTTWWRTPYAAAHYAPATRGAGQALVAQRRSDGQVMVRPWSETGGFGTATVLGGSTRYAPAAVRTSTGLIKVFITATDGTLRERTFNGTSWSSWRNLGGWLQSRPYAVALSSGRVDVVGTGSSRNVSRAKVYAGGTVSWVSHGGRVWRGTGPAIARDGSGRLDIVYQGTDRAVWHKRFRNGAWSGWRSLGGRVTGDVSLVSDRAGMVTVLAVNDSFAMVAKNITDGGTSGWVSAGGRLRTIPGAWGTDRRIDALIISVGGYVYHDARISGTWSGWSRS